MFDDVFSVAAVSTDNFREGVRDSFSSSIIAEALEPILKEIDSLRHNHESFKQQAIQIEALLEQSRCIGKDA